MIDRFLTGTGRQFECAAICGRRFAGIDEHAAYLRDGGCEPLVAVLAGGG